MSLASNQVLRRDVGKVDGIRHREAIRFPVRHEPARAGDADMYEDKVSSTIGTIERAAHMFDEVQGNLAQLEDKFHSMSEENELLMQEKTSAHQELARAEDLIRSAYERAASAEARAEAAETRAADLDRQIVSLTMQLDRMISAVSDTFFRRLLAPAALTLQQI